MATIRLNTTTSVINPNNASLNYVTDTSSEDSSSLTEEQKEIASNITTSSEGILSGSYDRTTIQDVADQINAATDYDDDVPAAGIGISTAGVVTLDGAVATNSTSSSTITTTLTTSEVSSTWFDIVDAFVEDTVYLKDWLDSNPSSNSYDFSERLFNLPYHLMESVDMPYNQATSLGRMFAEKISSSARILYIAPCSPIYAPETSDKVKNAFMSILTEGDSNSATTLINNSSDEIQGKYFDAKLDYSSYMLYVNGLCRALALYMNLGDEIGPDGETKLYKYRWDNYRYMHQQGTATADGVFSESDTGLETDDSGNFILDLVDNFEETVNFVRESVFGDGDYTQYYLDTNSNFSESYGNNTTESALKSKLNSLSSSAREISFLANTGGIDTSTWGEKVGSTISTLLSGFESLEGVVARLADGATTIINGNQMVFPSMWDSFSRDKSYSLTFNLQPPYGNDKAVYLETWVPLIHLMCLCLPKQVKDNPNAVASPFLVKCFCKGLFSCQMGVVTSMLIDKSDNINANNLPARIRVTLYIRDLYDEFSMSPSNKPIQFFNNTSLIEFLGVTAGLNLACSMLPLKLKLFRMLVTNTVTDIPGNLYSSAIQSIRNIVKNIFGADY